MSATRAEESWEIVKCSVAIEWRLQSNVKRQMLKCCNQRELGKVCKLIFGKSWKNPVTYPTKVKSVSIEWPFQSEKRKVKIVKFKVLQSSGLSKAKAKLVALSVL